MESKQLFHLIDKNVDNNDIKIHCTKKNFKHKVKLGYSGYNMVSKLEMVLKIWL